MRCRTTCSCALIRQEYKLTGSPYSPLYALPYSTSQRDEEVIVVDSQSEEEDVKADIRPPHDEQICWPRPPSHEASERENGLIADELVLVKSNLKFSEKKVAVTEKERDCALRKIYYLEQQVKTLNDSLDEKGKQLEEHQREKREGKNGRHRDSAGSFVE
uniref:Uncharacterized protein n=1 Tax=Palpitomonas bilix TaxID=652834 RepID=A0A7S3DCK5_9EUKA|mmetsp:Transcript_31210/g.81871  ORF Transcript_31210/g.81871 Transcript_31210/m.81871 type:complete len:160 (+) Transcript_31210:366-845(+)